MLLAMLRSFIRSDGQTEIHALVPNTEDGNTIRHFLVPFFRYRSTMAGFIIIASADTYSHRQ